MRKKVFIYCKNDEIIEHENRMLATYNEKVMKYQPLFKEKGYSLNTGMMWKRFPRDDVAFKRGDFQNGYQCYVYCKVLKDGKEVMTRSNDDEDDYYSLSTGWMISYVRRFFFRLYAELYFDTEDADEDLLFFLSQI